MTMLNDFHTVIQQTIYYFSSSTLSYEKIAKEQGLSKQAVHQQVQKGLEYLKNYEQSKFVEPAKLQVLEKEVVRLSSLTKMLQKELCLRSVEIYQLKDFKEKVNKIFPNFKASRIPARGKKYLLDVCAKFQKLGGTVSEFSKAASKSPSTILKWKKDYEEKGMAGLHNKKTRPKNFGNKIPTWVKVQLLSLFIKFPNWTEYQYHNHIKYSPSAKYYVSLPTIKKLKDLSKKKSALEKERIKKRWAFAPCSDVWTVDYTCIIKTENYKLQLLTVSDARSRFVFESSLFLESSTDSMMNHLEDLFTIYGKPSIIKADNGPEFRMDCKSDLRDLGVYLFNSPIYYGQFNAAHERLHRTLKNYLGNFKEHKNLTKLVGEISKFKEEYNHNMNNDYLNGKTPFEVYGDSSFVPNVDVNLVTPYEKEDELRVKFTDRNGQAARIVIDESIK